MKEVLEEKQTETSTNKCPSCGAVMTYDVASTDLKCAHCGTTIDFTEDDKVMRRAMTDEIIKTHENWNDGAVFKCSNCGAKGVLGSKDIAKSCAFCGSPHIVDTHELAGIKPDSIIPFQITKESARAKFLKWLKSRFFAPRILKQIDNKVENFNAMYSSSWSFGAMTQSSYHGTLGRYETRTTNRNGRASTHTTTRWFKVSGSISQEYRDFFVQSGDKIPVEMFRKIKPFNMSFLKVYRQEYLSGIIAEHYSRNIELCFNDFAAFVKKDIRNKIIFKHNADTVQSLTINTSYSDKKFNYVLLPVYIANYTYQNKVYNFYVNGVSGKIAGKYPVSGKKIFFTILGVGLAVAVVVALVAAFS